MFNKKVQIIQPYEIKDTIEIKDYFVQVVSGPIVVMAKLHNRNLAELLLALCPLNREDTMNNHRLSSLIINAHALGCSVSVTTTDPDSFPIWILGGATCSKTIHSEGERYILHNK